MPDGRISVERGRASAHLCVDCGVPVTAWSYDHGRNPDPDESTHVTPTGATCRYSVDPDRYVPRCRKCHAATDPRTSSFPVDQVVIRYQGGEGAKSIGLDFGVSIHPILRVLRETGVVIRPGRRPAASPRACRDACVGHATITGDPDGPEEGATL